MANGDPGNDEPGLMQCLDATYRVTGPEGTRDIRARDFYESAYFTARADDEILTRITVPVPATGTGYAYEKQKRKIRDYTTAAAAVLVGEGFALIAMTNLADVPVWSAEAGAALAAGDREGAVKAALAAIDPQEDMRGPVEFKTHVVGVVMRRAIDRALSRAAGGSHEQDACETEGERRGGRRAGRTAHPVDPCPAGEPGRDRAARGL